MATPYGPGGPDPFMGSQGACWVSVSVMAVSGCSCVCAEPLGQCGRKKPPFALRLEDDPDFRKTGPRKIWDGSWTASPLLHRSFRGARAADWTRLSPS